MQTILKLLAGKAGVWILVVALGAAAAAGAAGGAAVMSTLDSVTVAEARQHAAEAATTTAICEKDRETERADQNQTAIGEITRSLADLQAVNDRLAKAMAARDRATKDFMEKLSHAPHTNACVSSPAIQLYLDSLRHAGSD